MNTIWAQTQPSENVSEVMRDLSDKAVESGQATWQRVTTQITELVANYLPSIAAALVVLVLGWILALVVAAVVRASMHKLSLDKKLAGWLSPDFSGEPLELSRRVGKGVFYLLMLFVLVAFLQTLGLTLATQPLTAFLNQIFEYAPRLIAAGVLLFVAWIVARIVKFVIQNVLAASNIDQRLTREAGVATEESLPLTKTLSEATYWLVFLLFLPALLDALAVPGLLAPVQNMVTDILAFVPNLFGAAVIFGIGWFVARIVQRITTNLLRAVGTDQFSENLGIARVMGDNRLSDVIGLAVYILILVPVIVGSLNALQIESVTRPASDMLNTILSVLPGIFAAVLVVSVAYVVGRVVSGLAARMLAGIGFDSLPARLGLTTPPAEGRRSPSEIAGIIIMVAIVLFATMQALPMLGFDLLAEMMAQFLEFAGHVFVGLVVFGFGLYFARLVADIIRDMGIANANLLATLARVAILVLAGAMGLQQMGLAQEIVNIAFGLTLGAVAVAAAIAFGIGGRDTAKTLIEDFTRRHPPLQS